MLKQYAILFTGLLAFSTGRAFADTVSYSDSVPLSNTDWASNIHIQQFDPSLGTLNSIQFDLAGHIQGGAFYESQEPLPTTVDMTLSASLTLSRPDMTVIVVTLPSVTVHDTPTGFDGLIDFGGTSGRTYSGISADHTESTISPPPLSDLILFTGLSTISLPVSAEGDSSGVGPGNWIFGFNTSASATATVTYTYTPVPEPSSALLATGLLAASGLRREVRRHQR